MIETAHEFAIEAPLPSVWDYVRDMERWAALFPGCRECQVIDERRSRWVVKVGVGGLVRTVHVLVDVERWAGPEAVDFRYHLADEPVVGRGAYRARGLEAGRTAVTLSLEVEGSGAMAPLWEAMCRPLLPQLAATFAAALKEEIERRAGVAAPPSGRWARLRARLARWLARVGRRRPFDPRSAPR